MKHIDIRKTFSATVATGVLTLTACSAAANPQGGTGGGMMGDGSGNGWMGGYGWPWILIVLVVVAGLVGWAIARGRNKN